jgi:CheY-like chemotaxis protein
MKARREVILIVDDDPEMRTSLAELLGECGYDTLTEGHGAAALDLLDNLAAVLRRQALRDAGRRHDARNGRLHVCVRVAFSTGHGVGPGDLDVRAHSKLDAALCPRLLAETARCRPLDEGDSCRRAGESVELQLMAAPNAINQGSP